MKIKMPKETFKFLILLDGVVNWDGVLKSGDRPCYTFMKLDKNTYFTEFSLEMFISR